MALLMFRDSIVGQLCRWIFRPQCLLYPLERLYLPSSFDGITRPQEIITDTVTCTKHEEIAETPAAPTLRAPGVNKSALAIVQDSDGGDDPVNPKDWRTWKKVAVCAEIWYVHIFHIN